MFFTDFSSVLQTMLHIGLAGLAFATVVYFIFWLFTKKKLTASIPTHILRYLFLTYCLCLLLLTWTSEGEANLGSNFVPFSSVFYAIRSGFEIAYLLIFLNILMFVPMGIFLPLVFPKIDKLWKVVLPCLGATLLIEAVQAFLPGRAFDIDDVIMNTLGGAIGFSVYTIVLWVRKKPKQSLFAKLSAIGVLLLIPVFLGSVFLLDSKEFRYGFSHRLYLPKEMKLTEENTDYPQTAPIYMQDTTDPYDMMASLQTKFGITGEIEDAGSSIQCVSGDKQLSVFTEMDGWEYTSRTTDDTPTALPDGELIAQSESFLKKYDLWDDAYVVDHIGDIQTDTRVHGEAEEPVTAYDPSHKPDYIKVTGRTVSFVIDTLEKVANTTICFDSNGIYKVESSINIYSVYKNMPLLSPEEAMRALSRSGSCSFYANIFKPESAVFFKATLVYTNSLDQKQQLPAWKLEGTFYGKNFSDKDIEADGYILVEAIKQ